MVAAIGFPIWYSIPPLSNLKPVTEHTLTIPLGHVIKDFIRNDLKETLIYAERVFGMGGRAYHAFTCESGVSGVKIEEPLLARDYPYLVELSKAAEMRPLNKIAPIILRKALLALPAPPPVAGLLTAPVPQRESTNLKIRPYIPIGKTA